MSFSTDVKEDILTYNSEKKLHSTEFVAMLRFGGEVLVSPVLKIVFSTSSSMVFRHFLMYLKELYSEATYQMFSRTMQKLHHSTIYTCMIEQEALTIAEAVHLLEDFPPDKETILADPMQMIAYLRGAFLVKGTVNNPSTSNYHLEIAAAKETEALFLQRCMNAFSLNARISKRRNDLIVYIKEKDAIVDFLRYLGANVSMNEFENVIIKRNLAANINRLMNIDVANQQKTNQTAKEQLKYIKYLEYYYPLEKLDPKLLLVMKVRKENPEASFSELIAIINQNYDESITKSGLNHRFRKIKEIAQQHENKRKEASWK